MSTPKTEINENIQESFKDIIAKAKEKKASKKDDNAKDKDDDNESDDDSENENDKKEKKNKDDKKDAKVEINVKEGTEAANSLHPGARSISDPKSLTSSKLGMMNHTMGLMSGLGKNDMVKFFDQVIDQFGPGKQFGVGDNSSKNQNTLDMHGSHAVSKSGSKLKEPMLKLSVKEDLDSIFNDNEELSEEFKESASTLFEAAISARVIAEKTRLEEEYADALVEELSTFQEDLTKKLDMYLDYVVESWIKENEVAIESSLQNEMTKEFIDGLRNLFAEHYIEIPEERSNVMEQLADKVSELESKLNEQITENESLKSSLLENSAKEVINSVSADLTISQQEKFAALAEGIEYDGDIDRYERKLNIIKETHFKEDSHQTNLNEETFEEPVSAIKNNDPYTSFMDRWVKPQ